MSFLLRLLSPEKSKAREWLETLCSVSGGEAEVKSGVFACRGVSWRRLPDILESLSKAPDYVGSFSRLVFEGGDELKKFRIDVSRREVKEGEETRYVYDAEIHVYYNYERRDVPVRLETRHGRVEARVVAQVSGSKLAKAEAGEVSKAVAEAMEKLGDVEEMVQELDEERKRVDFLFDKLSGCIKSKCGKEEESTPSKYID